MEYDKILHGIIDSSSSSDPDNIQNDIDQLNQDIESLSEAARSKELEWNNILYLKKMKEDMLVRLVRKKAVMDIMSSKLSDDSDANNTYNNYVDHLTNEGGTKSQTQNNANLPNHNQALPRITVELATERSNMKSSDLAKERSNITRMHRYVLYVW